MAPSVYISFDCYQNKDVDILHEFMHTGGSHCPKGKSPIFLAPYRMTKHGGRCFLYINISNFKVNTLLGTCSTMEKTICKLGVSSFFWCRRRRVTALRYPTWNKTKRLEFCTGTSLMFLGK